MLVSLGTFLPNLKVGETSNLTLEPKNSNLPQPSDPKSMAYQFGIKAVLASKFHDSLQNFNCPNLRRKGRGQHKSKTMKIPNNLKIWLRFDVGDRVFEFQALIDTGAEVDVIKRGIIRHKFLFACDEPITISAADSSKLDGGSLCVNGTAFINGFEVDTKNQAEIHCPFF
jgi:hypothetical protein